MKLNTASGDTQYFSYQLDNEIEDNPSDCKQCWENIAELKTW